MTNSNLLMFVLPIIAMGLSLFSLLISNNYIKKILGLLTFQSSMVIFFLTIKFTPLDKNLYKIPTDLILVTMLFSFLTILFAFFIVAVKNQSPSLEENILFKKNKL